CQPAGPVALVFQSPVPDFPQPVHKDCSRYNSAPPHESLNNLTPEEYRLMAETPEISKSARN
ncbi:hypothetical protein VOD00_20560, partial [Escherichia coli]|nr:hypothetical protein [Escherichia coli]